MNDCIVFFEDEPPYLEQIEPGRIWFNYLLGSGAQWEKRAIARFSHGSDTPPAEYLYVGYPEMPGTEQLTDAVARLKPKPAGQS